MSSFAFAYYRTQKSPPHIAKPRASVRKTFEAETPGAESAFPKLSTEQRCALATIAEGDNGCLDAVLQLLGFSDDLVAELIHARLARAEAKRAIGGERTVNVRRIRILQAGWRELDAGPSRPLEDSAGWRPRPAADLGERRAEDFRTEALGGTSAEHLESMLGGQFDSGGQWAQATQGKHARMRRGPSANFLIKL